MKLNISVFAFVMLLGGCATMPNRPANMAPDDYSYTKEYVTWLIKKEMKKRNVTGLSIALVDDQRVVWAEGFGYADKANLVAATPNTIYRAGSISKLFTATALMQLAEQNKVDIDKPLQNYLPDFSIKTRFADAGPITPRTIMTHHSGLPTAFVKGMWTRNPEPFTDIVEHLAEDYAAYPPNYIFSYSNLGVTLLGCSLEKVTGQPFASYMDTQLLAPLGMNHSAFSQYPDSSSLAAKAYRNGIEAEEIPLRDTPAGGLNTTALDLSRFIEMVFAGGWAGARQIIKPETLAEMLHPQNDNVSLDFDHQIGLAWGLGSISIQNGGLVAGHSGATICHRSILRILPEYKLGVVVLSSSASAGSVVDKVANKTLTLALETKTGHKQPDEKHTPAEASMPYEKLRTYEGRYDTVMGVEDIRAKSDYLQVKMMNKTLRLVPHADGRFYLQYKLLGLFPITLGDLANIGISRVRIEGRDILKARNNDLEFLVGEKIEPVPLSDKWRQRTGEYQCVNNSDDAVRFEKLLLREDNGLLLLDYSVPLFYKDIITLVLEPVSDSEAVIFGLGRGKGETIRSIQDGGGELLWYSGYQFKKK